MTSSTGSTKQEGSTTKTTQAAKIIVVNSTSNITSPTTTITSSTSATGKEATVTNAESTLTSSDTTVTLSVTKSSASVAVSTPKLPTVATSGSHMVSSISSEILKGIPIGFTHWYLFMNQPIRIQVVSLSHHLDTFRSVKKNLGSSFCRY